MKSRCSAAERLQKLKEGGVPNTCESAVSRALEYLKTQQNPDGSFSKANKAAMTGFSLLCYFGRCETPDSPYYGDNFSILVRFVKLLHPPKVLIRKSSITRFVFL